MEETREFVQTETEEPRTEEPEKPETEDPETEEPEKPETYEHDVPPALDKPDPVIAADRTVIVEVVKEDDKQTEKEDKKDAAEDFSETETDVQGEAAVSDILSAEASEISDTEIETQPENEAESESAAASDSDAVFEADWVETLEDVSETETETYSEMLLDAGEDINMSYLQSIDLKLTCIVFILLFSVCERKLRYAVRSLCGRIKND